MPYMTSIERIGKIDGQRAVLRRIVQARFGTVPEDLNQYIATADEETLNRLADRVSTVVAPEDLLP